MYLFFFAVLWIVYQYVYGKGVYEKQDHKIVSLKAKVSQLEDSLSSQNVHTSRYFKLKGNEKAYAYFDAFHIDFKNLEQRLEDEIISQNSTQGNPLVPYDNSKSGYRVNKVEVLNHKWIIADFTDNVNWGEMLLRYDIAADGTITFENLQAILYPQE
ncbi:MAG: hydrolase [Cytophagaceae bacterium]|nr:hydrolase [Cytophagaceae bacterium]